MRNLKKIVAVSAIAFSSILMGCQVEEPSIICGRDWNPGAQVVADTTSEFDLKDPFIVQYKYGKNFDFTKLKITFFEGTLANKGKEIWNREVSVSEKMGSYTLQGKSNHGGLMTAREMTRQKKPGNVVVEFSTEGRVLMAKELTLVKNK